MQLVDGTATLVTIPDTACIKVLSGPNGTEHDKGLVYVLWEQREIALFAVDVAARGIEIKDPDSGYKPANTASA